MKRISSWLIPASLFSMYYIAKFPISKFLHINIVFPYFLCYPLRTFVLFGGLCRILRYSLILLQQAMLATQTHSFALVTPPVSHAHTTKALTSHALPEILHITGWLKTISISWSWSGTQNISKCTVTGDRMSLT